MIAGTMGVGSHLLESETSHEGSNCGEGLHLLHPALPALLNEPRENLLPNPITAEGRVNVCRLDPRHPVLPKDDSDHAHVVVGKPGRPVGRLDDNVLLQRGTAELLNLLELAGPQWHPS